jgi:hypothetical protein
MCSLAGHVLECVIERGINRDFLAGRAAQLSDRAAHCFACGRVLRVFHWISNDGGIPRVTGLCSRCAVVVESEVGIEIWNPFELRPGEIRFSRDLICGVARIGILVRTPEYKQRGQMVGLGEASCQLTLEPGLSDVTAIMILKQGELVVARQPVWV